MPSENLVKAAIKKALEERGWKTWPTAQGAYSVKGPSDRMALRNGVFMAVEAKLHPNKPTENQKRFLRMVRAQQCLSFVVSDKTFDLFTWFLNAFDRAVEAQMQNQDASEEDKEAMVSATAVLIKPFMEE